MRVVVLALLSALAASPALAHRLNAFAAVDGLMIRGAAYFPGMGVARGLDVKVLAPDGSLIATTTTDDAGRFAVVARERIDHRVVIDGGDGHSAVVIIRAAEFPESLPQAPSGAADMPTVGGVPTPPASAAPLPLALEAAIDSAVARHIGPLREQLDAFENAVRFRDILGGLGWIIGLTGVACWVAARRR